MLPLLTITLLTLREASRRRLLLAVAILTILVIAATGWGFSRLETLDCGRTPCSSTEIRALASGMVLLVAFMFSFVIALGAAFIAAPAIAGDVESGIALAVLPRPIRRSDVVLGKWLGLSVLITLYTFLAGLVEVRVIEIAVGYVPPHPYKSLAFLAGEGLVLLTLALLGSTRFPPLVSGICAVVLFGMGWLGGIAETIGTAFHNTVITNIGIISSLVLPTDGLFRGAMFNLEPVALIAAASNVGRAAGGNPFLVTAPPTNAFLVWAVGWVAVMLYLASASFSSREL